MYRCILCYPSKKKRNKKLNTLPCAPIIKSYISDSLVHSDCNLEGIFTKPTLTKLTWVLLHIISSTEIEGEICHTEKVKGGKTSTWSGKPGFSILFFFKRGPKPADNANCRSISGHVNGFRRVFQWHMSKPHRYA